MTDLTDCERAFLDGLFHEVTSENGGSIMAWLQEHRMLPVELKPLLDLRQAELGEQCPPEPRQISIPWRDRQELEQRLDSLGKRN